MNTATDTFDQFFVMRGQQKLGPFSLEEMKNLWQRGQIESETLYWQKGMDEWSPLSQIAECFAPQRYESAIERARKNPASYMPPASRSTNPDGFGAAVLWAILLPIVGLVFAIRYLMDPQYRGAGGAILGISFASSVIWTFLLYLFAIAAR